MNCHQRNSRSCNIEELSGNSHGQRCSLQEGWQLPCRKLLPFRNTCRSVMSLSAAGSCSNSSLYPSSGFLQQTAGANDGFHRPVTLLLLPLLFLTTSWFSSDLASFLKWDALLPSLTLPHSHEICMECYFSPQSTIWLIIAVPVVGVRGDTKKTATSAFFHKILDSVAPVLCVLQLNTHLRNALIIIGFEGISIIFKFKGVYS